MNDWAAFTESVPWFLDRDAAVDVSAPRKRPALSPLATTLFPSLPSYLPKRRLPMFRSTGVAMSCLHGTPPMVIDWGGSVFRQRKPRLSISKTITGTC